MRAIVFGLATLIACVSQAQTATWQSVEAALGGKGISQEDGARQFEFLRRNLQIQNSAGMLIASEMGLASVISFRGTPSDSRVTGDICLIRQEIDDVMDSIRSSGFNIVTLSSRLSGEQPAVYFLQFEGNGEGEKLAASIKRALAELGKERLISEGLKRTGEFPVVDWKSVSVVLGRTVQQVGSSRVWRADLGEGSWINFGGCPCGRTMLLGRLVVSRTKLQRTIKVIRGKAISVTSILPRSDELVEVGLEGEGDAVRLAAGVRAGISKR